jgi:hypothetical protein
MDTTSNVRPVWLRIVQFPLVRLVVLGFITMYCLAVSNDLMSQNAARPSIAITAAVAMGWLAMGVYYGFGRVVERREVSELSTAGMGWQLGAGMLVGAGLYTASVLVLMVLGMYRIDGLNPVSFMVPAIAMAISSGVLEEIIFRGVLFRIVEEWLGSWIALVISSAVFGLVHLMNPAATWTGAVFISVEAGLLLAAAYMLTRRLWLSMGFHIAWNYTQSAVFSGIVSGGDTDPGLIRATITGPAALTGGTFGLEASVIAFVLCTATGVAMLAMAVKKGNVVRPVWTRRGDRAEIGNR